MHDVCEGIIPKILQMILTSYSNKNTFAQARQTSTATRKLILHRFERFDFFEGRPSLQWDASTKKINEIDEFTNKTTTKTITTGFKISGKAVQVCIF